MVMRLGELRAPNDLLSNAAAALFRTKLRKRED
jgi:hypothetical protein